MSKPYNIRWKSSDNAELRRAVKNFNAKISRLEKKNPQEKAALPERVTVKQLKSLISTRQDLNREINALKRFSKRGAEDIIIAPDNKYNLKITKWQRDEMNRRAAVINRKRKKRLDEVAGIELESRGEKLGYTKGAIGMGKAEEVSLQPIRAFTPGMSRQDLQRKFATIQKESQTNYWHERELRMKANYIKSLEENFNPADIEDVVEAIDNMDFREFRKIFEAEGGNFELSYPPDAESYQAHLSALKAIYAPNKKPEDGSKPIVLTTYNERGAAYRGNYATVGYAKRAAKMRGAEEFEIRGADKQIVYQTSKLRNQMKYADKRGAKALDNLNTKRNKGGK